MPWGARRTLDPPSAGGVVPPVEPVMTTVTTLDRHQRVADAARALEVDGITAEVVTAFADTGIPSLLLKGPAVASWLYSASDVRSYKDVDLLVPVARLPEAEAVLAGMGFRYILEGADAIEEIAHARTWQRRDLPAVDLHTSLAELPSPPVDVWSVLAADATELLVAGRPVAVPRPACLAFIVALHALQRGPDERQLIGELERALASADAGVWVEAAQVARELGAGGHLRAALGLAPGGSALADWLRLPDAPVRAAILAVASADARACALSFDRIGSCPSWRGKASLLLRAVVPTPEFVQAAKGSDRMSRAAYYRRRLARLRGLVAGFRLWRSAVRTCGASRRASDRIEVIVWSLVARAGIATMGIQRTLLLLDRSRLRRTGGEDLASTRRDALFRLAGRCLGESVARSQYLRVRGQPHEVVLGVSGPVSGLRAHAWLEPLDAGPRGFEAVHRFSR